MENDNVKTETCATTPITQFHRNTAVATVVIHDYRRSRHVDLCHAVPP